MHFRFVIMGDAIGEECIRYLKNFHFAIADPFARPSNEDNVNGETKDNKILEGGKVRG